MQRPAALVTLLFATLFLSGCASGAQRREARREALAEVRADQIAASTVRDVKRAIGYRDAADLLAEMQSGAAAGFDFDFAWPVATVESAARSVLTDYGIRLDYDTSQGDRSFLVGETGVNGRGLGELVGITVGPGSAQLSHILIVSRRRLDIVPFEKDWTSDILAGVKAKLESVDPGMRAQAAATQDSVGVQPQQWLNEIQAMVGQAFAGVDSPTLIVVCEGKEGGYLADRIISALGSASRPVRIVASGKDLDLALQEQEKSVSGVYDQATTVQVGKLRGARYAFYGTPYVKRSQNVVELSCKILDIESGDYLNAGRIVTLPLSELPEN